MQATKALPEIVISVSSNSYSFPKNLWILHSQINMTTPSFGESEDNYVVSVWLGLVFKSILPKGMNSYSEKLFQLYLVCVEPTEFYDAEFSTESLVDSFGRNKVRIARHPFFQLGVRF